MSLAVLAKRGRPSGRTAAVQIDMQLRCEDYAYEKIYAYLRNGSVPKPGTFAHALYLEHGAAFVRGDIPSLLL